MNTSLLDLNTHYEQALRLLKNNQATEAIKLLNNTERLSDNEFGREGDEKALAYFYHFQLRYELGLYSDAVYYGGLFLDCARLPVEFARQVCYGMGIINLDFFGDTQAAKAYLETAKSQNKSPDEIDKLVDKAFEKLDKIQQIALMIEEAPNTSTTH